MKRDDISHSHLSTGEEKKSSPAESSIFINTFPPPILISSWLSSMCDMFDVKISLRVFSSENSLDIWSAEWQLPFSLHLNEKLLPNFSLRCHRNFILMPVCMIVTYLTGKGYLFFYFIYP